MNWFDRFIYWLGMETFKIILTIITVIIIACNLPKPANADIPTPHAIKAILGESRGEFGWQITPLNKHKKLKAMTLIAEAMRNRAKLPLYKNNPLKGVYGFYNYIPENDLKGIQNHCIKKFKKGKSLDWCLNLAEKTYAKLYKEYTELSQKAWEESAKSNHLKGAYIWGNEEDIKKFKKEKWFNNFEPVLTFGTHTFFKEKIKPKKKEIK